MHLLICADDSEPELRLEIAQAFPEAAVHEEKPSLLAAGFPLPSGQQLPYLVFARQLFPHVSPTKADSISGWARAIFEHLVGCLPENENEPWALHVEPHYGTRSTHRMGARAWHSVSAHSRQSIQAARPTRPDAIAGKHRCLLIRQAVLELLKEKRRQLLRQLRAEPGPFVPKDSLVQVLLTSPDSGFISFAPAPMPFEQRHIISPFPAGEVPLASDKLAPSRAFAKLLEAEARFGRSIRPGETCVDLGASPGSWTYVAVNRGARVVAVDRSPLREDLMYHPQVKFRNVDAFAFEPRQLVDWLLCDVIAAPERSADLLLKWLRHGWCHNFVVTIKMKQDGSEGVLKMLKAELPACTRELILMKLCANKKEVCAFGSVACGS
jgi:23S rRNA (cytidine2498-2'-O)-methyltransferase